MNRIICIDTSGPDGQVLLAENGIAVAMRQNAVQQQHAAFLHPAISALLQEKQLTWSDIHAIAVSNGPGSYTGLRIGLSAAKGLCFALQLPLVLMSSLRILAGAVLLQLKSEEMELTNALVCPMIDARRMEVFTSVYSTELYEIEAPGTQLVDAQFKADLLQQQVVYFTGSGASKWQDNCRHPHARFVNTPDTVKSFSLLAHEAFQQESFADIAYSEPFYCKAFFTPGKAAKT